MDDDAENMRALAGGIPPDWFPPVIREDALLRRRNLLRNGMTMDALREAAEEVIKVHRDNFAHPDYVIHEHRGTLIRDGKPDATDRDIRIFARYLYAAELGEKNGLAVVLGNEHAGLAIHGKQMRLGRKEGTVGPVRKFIRKALAKKPKATNEELWAAIKANPPKGWTPMENKLGCYIEGPASGDEVKWTSFCNYAAKERGLLKSSNRRGVKAG